MSAEPHSDISVVFQPIVDLVTGRVLGYEALGRLQGKEDQGFGPLQQWAKERGRMAAVLRQLQAETLKASSGRPPGTLLFMNMTMGQLSALTTYLFQHPEMPASSLVLEIPEQDGRIERWQARLQDFRAKGVGIAIDDWGVGAADPLRLIHLQPNWLKIDVALVRRVGVDDAVDRLLDLLVRWINPETTHLIAEGVETSEQIVALRRLGIRYGQGFAIARPQKAWPLTIDLPAVSNGRISLRRQPLALMQTLSLTDGHLERIALEQHLILPILNRAVAAFTTWMGSTVLHLRAHATDRLLYTRLLERHFTELVRGQIGEGDVERANEIARVHQRLGIDLSYYLIGYRKVQAEVARALREAQRIEVAEIMREVFTFDLSVVMQAYQTLLDRDALTGILTRRAFWDGVDRQIPDALTRNQSWALGLMDLEGFQKVNRRFGHAAGDRILAKTGELLRELMSSDFLVGRLGGEEFGLWMPHREGHSVGQEVARVQLELERILPDVAIRMGAAVLGRDGTSASALYTAADQRLLRRTASKTL